MQAHQLCGCPLIHPLQCALVQMARNPTPLRAHENQKGDFLQVQRRSVLCRMV
jgi:hypothetical protein